MTRDTKSRLAQWDEESDQVLEGIREIALNKEERAGDRLRAYELLGKYLNLFVEKQKHEHSGGVTIEVEYITGDSDPS